MPFVIFSFYKYATGVPFRKQLLEDNSLYEDIIMMKISLGSYLLEGYCILEMFK